MSTTTETQPDLNHAAARLIDALDDMAALPGLREGLARTIAYTERAANPYRAEHAEALDALAVWRALDDLAAAVAARKENADD